MIRDRKAIAALSANLTLVPLGLVAVLAYFTWTAPAGLTYRKEPYRYAV